MFILENRRKRKAMYRLYVDEVGTDDLVSVEEDNHRFLSLSGVAMEVTHARDELSPKLDWIKVNVFDHDPDSPLILHRSHIVQKKGAFGQLRDNTKLDLFDRSIMRVIDGSEYCVITAFIDKRGMLRQNHWRNQHPYHFLMEILVEKFTQFLERKNDIGDIMPEGRKGKKDTKLQEAFISVKNSGTHYVSSDRINSRIRADTLKFRYKRDDIAGLQLCDLLAHPSHICIREMQKHAVEIGPFGNRVKELLLNSKYDRSPYDGRIIGYGVKWLP